MSRIGSTNGIDKRALVWVRRMQPRDSGILWGQLKRVAFLGTAVDQVPSLYLTSTLSGSSCDAETLVAQMLHIDALAGDLVLPRRPSSRARSWCDGRDGSASPIATIASSLTSSRPSCDPRTLHRLGYVGVPLVVKEANNQFMDHGEEPFKTALFDRAEYSGL